MQVHEVSKDFLYMHMLLFKGKCGKCGKCFLGNFVFTSMAVSGSPKRW